MIIYELTMGENFSEALAKQGTIFPRLLINMIKTAELTGDLPETLDDMADYYRETEKQENNGKCSNLSSCSITFRYSSTYIHNGRSYPTIRWYLQ